MKSRKKSFIRNWACLLKGFDETKSRKLLHYALEKLPFYIFEKSTSKHVLVSFYECHTYKKMPYISKVKRKMTRWKRDNRLNFVTKYQNIVVIDILLKPVWFQFLALMSGYFGGSLVFVTKWHMYFGIWIFLAKH